MRALIALSIGCFQTQTNMVPVSFVASFALSEWLRYSKICKCKQFTVRICTDQVCYRTRIGSKTRFSSSQTKCQNYLDRLMLARKHMQMFARSWRR